MAFTLVYHGKMEKFLGRGWAPMMILEEAGANYECKNPEDKPPVTFAPPMVITPGGAQVSQTPICCVVLGKELGLWPKDIPSDGKAMQYCCDAADFMSDGSKPVDRIEKWFAHFESALALSGGPFLFGESLTAADYTTFTALVAATSKEEAAAALKKFEKLSSFMAKMKEQKGYKAVEAKGLPYMPG